MFNQKEEKEQVRDCTASKLLVEEFYFGKNKKKVSCCVSLLVTLKVDGNQLTTGPLQPAGHYNDNKKNNEPN